MKPFLSLLSPPFLLLFSSLHTSRAFYLLTPIWQQPLGQDFHVGFLLSNSFWICISRSWYWNITHREMGWRERVDGPLAAKIIYILKTQHFKKKHNIFIYFTAKSHWSQCSLSLRKLGQDVQQFPSSTGRAIPDKSNSPFLFKTPAPPSAP